MRVAILTELFPPSIGGQEIRLAEISQELVRRGHSVHVFSVLATPGSQPEETIDGIVIHRYPEAYNYRQPSLKWLRRQPFVVLKYALRCRRIDANAFDLLILNQWPLAHICLAPASIRSKSVIDWCEFREGALFDFIQRKLPRMAAGNMANSIALKHQLERLSGVAFECIPSGIYASRYRCAPAEQRNGILSLGRIEQHKNLPLVLSSYESLVAKGYSGRLRIAGTGPEVADLQRLVKSSRCAAQIDLMGFITDKQKIELLATSEVFMLASRREGFPRAVAEAMASGLPVVIADYPENGTIDVARQYGIGMVAEPVPDKLAESCLAVIANWNCYSQAGLTASQSLDWNVLVDKLLQTAVRIEKGNCA